jgi:heavy metal sensor kinase
LTLTTRLLLFFLGTLALVLAGFSTALYFLASAHLHRQSEERLETSLNTLVAAIEVHPNGVEWEPDVRQLPFDARTFGGVVVWALIDDDCRAVDGSKELAVRERLADVTQQLRTGGPADEHQDWQGERWQFRSRRLAATSPDAPQQPVATKYGWIYPALSITTGVSLEPARATLRQLTVALAGLSVGVWLIAAFVGRAVCRRGLLPVTRMAASARAMTATDLDDRLPAVGTGDELDDLSRSFNGLLDRLQESFERQRRFTGDASHQLRTPLTALLGQLEVALRRERPPEEYQRVLTKVHDKAGHLRRIVESLLFLARADADAQLPERERVDLHDWLPEHLRQWSGHPRFGDIVAANGNDDPFTVQAQPAVLGELLDILFDNACKYSPPGSAIAVRVSRDGNEVCVQIEDRGCGIAEADVPHLFTPFYRSDDARRRGVEGLGLGLSIAQRLARAFGGALTVRSRVGEGSCFTLRLPAAAAAPNEAVPVPSPASRVRLG